MKNICVGVSVSKLLIDEYQLSVLPTLAAEIGLNEAIILQQIHYWLENNRKFNRIKTYDGIEWIYNTYDDWSIQFPFWTKRTIRRIMATLKEKNLIFTGNYNSSKYDKTLWYSINYDKINDIESEVELKKAYGQNVHMEKDKMSKLKEKSCPHQYGQSGHITTETNAKTTSETTKGTNVPETEKPKKLYKWQKMLNDISIPTNLNTNEFKNAWSEYLQYRGRNRMILDEVALTGTLSEMSEWGEKNAIESIKRTMSKGWRGCFDPAQNKAYKKDTLSDVYNRVSKQYDNEPGNTGAFPQIGGV